MKNAKNLFASALIAIALFSCSKKDYIETPAEINTERSLGTIIPEDTMLVTPALPVPVPVNPLPTQPTPVPAGNSQQVISYTLVNASTDKDIMDIAPNATISLREVGTNKLNVRANMANGAGAVVKMNLSGADHKERYDDKAPFALFGDDNGNYHNWTAKTGSYTLKATPYTGTKANLGIVNGSTYSINFTIVR
jgi:hypothetical protein